MLWTTSVCQYCIEMVESMTLVYGTGATLGLSYLCYKGIWVFPETREIPSGTSSQSFTRLVATAG